MPNEREQKQQDRQKKRHFVHVATLIDEATSDAFVCADLENRIIHWNKAAETMFGYTAAEAIGQTLDIIMPERLRAAHRTGVQRVITGGPPSLIGKTVEVPAQHRDGRELPIELSLAIWSDPKTGKPAGFASIIRDISARKRLEAEKERTQLLLDTVIEHLPAMLFVKDAESREYILLNRTGEEIIGKQRSEVIGRTDAELFAEAGRSYMARDDELLAQGKTTVFESRHRREDDSVRILCTRRVAIDGADGRKLILGVCEDVTDRRSAEERIRFLADHDDLTKLANRSTFSRALDALAKQAGDGVVLCLDLDRFKAVNDLFGHVVGDGLLAEVARRLTEAAEAGATVARLGGDEFAILLNGASVHRAAEIAQRLIEAIDAPFVIDGRVAHIGVSIGIAVAPSDGKDAVELMRNADMALYRAKQKGRRSYCFFDSEMDRAARERRELEQDLRLGLKRGEIIVHYQPLASMADGSISGFEALARWNHPERGLIGPELFIPIAEEGGLIVELGRHVLNLALAEAALWRPPLRVAVNLSPMQFLQGDFAADVEAALRRWNVAPDRLELEVTEGVLIRDADAALAVLGRLKALGVSISMDDFGTGYSSLSYFRMFPFDKVKIDQSFIRDMAVNQQSMAVVHAVIGLARGLGMPVVAEGVETDEQSTLR